MNVIDSVPNGIDPTNTGMDWQDQAMYEEYLRLHSHFTNTGNGALADQLTLQMEAQAPIAGGTQPMLNNFADISRGGSGGYSMEDYSALTGGINPTNGELQPIAPSAQGSVANMANVSDTINGVGQTLNDPTKDNTQKAIDTGSKVTGGLAALGVGGAAVPILGAGLAVGGAVYDYNKNQKAELAMQNAMRSQQARRDIASFKYNKELDNDYARRELGFRGQTQGSPMYQNMMAQSNKNFQNQSQSNVDALEKGGMGDKSGMKAQLQGQNFNNLTKNVANATRDVATGNKRAYGGLQGLAVSGRPEETQYNYANKMYNESNNFGENLRPITNYAGAYAKKKARDAGMGYMLEDYNKNIGKEGV